MISEIKRNGWKGFSGNQRNLYELHLTAKEAESQRSDRSSQTTGNRPRFKTWKIWEQGGFWVSDVPTHVYTCMESHPWFSPRIKCELQTDKSQIYLLIVREFWRCAAAREQTKKNRFGVFSVLRCELHRTAMAVNTMHSSSSFMKDPSIEEDPFFVSFAWRRWTHLRSTALPTPAFSKIRIFLPTQQHGLEEKVSWASTQRVAVSRLTFTFLSCFWWCFFFLLCASTERRHLAKACLKFVLSFGKTLFLARPRYRCRSIFQRGF